MSARGGAILAAFAFLSVASGVQAEQCQTGRDYQVSKKCTCPAGSERKTQGKSGFRCVASASKASSKRSSGARASVKGATTTSGSGKLTAQQVSDTIDANIDALTGCINEDTVASTKLIVTGDGRVSEARISRSVPDDARIRDCLISTFRDIRFPKPSGGGGRGLAFNFDLQLFISDQGPGRAAPRSKGRGR